MSIRRSQSLVQHERPSRVERKALASSHTCAAGLVLAVAAVSFVLVSCGGQAADKNAWDEVKAFELIADHGYKQNAVRNTVNCLTVEAPFATDNLASRYVAYCAPQIRKELKRLSKDDRALTAAYRESSAFVKTHYRAYYRAYQTYLDMARAAHKAVLKLDLPSVVLDAQGHTDEAATQRLQEAKVKSVKDAQRAMTEANRQRNRSIDVYDRARKRARADIEAL